MRFIIVNKESIMACLVSVKSNSLYRPLHDKGVGKQKETIGCVSTQFYEQTFNGENQLECNDFFMNK